MNGRIVFTLVLAACALTAQAQPAALVSTQAADEVVAIGLTRIAVAQDGSFALAYEALVEKPGSSARWGLFVQRYSPAGSPVGPLHQFAAESCSGLDIWLSDFNEHPEIGFQPGGTLVVLMQHTGEFQIGSDGVRSAEMTLAAIDASGQVVDLNRSGACVQKKLIFPGGGRQDRPRLAVTPQGALIITSDGFFDRSSLRNVALRVLDANGDQVIEQVIPHDDPQSLQAFHMRPDIATNGALLLTVWNECPVVDNQGNANDCNIGAQLASITNAGLVAVGTNRMVNVGDAPGTLQLYPSAAMNAAGQSVIVWADARDGMQGEIYGQRLDANGEPSGPNFRVSAGDGDIDARPEVAVLDDGRFMVVWTDSAATGFAARGRQFAADGTPLGPTFKLMEATGAESGLPDVVVSDQQRFAYVWLSRQNGTYAVHANPSAPVTSHADDAPERPEAFALHAPHPNPFSTRTAVAFTLSRAGRVRLVVFDALGRELSLVMDEVQTAGTHTALFDGSGLPSGIYFVQIESGAFRAVQKMVLIR